MFVLVRDSGGGEAGFVAATGAPLRQSSGRQERQD